MLAILAVVLYVTVRVIQRVWARRRPALPQCRRCGYLVFGLPGFTCPECGSDLHGSGTLRPRPFAPRRVLSPVRRSAGAAAMFLVWWPAGVGMLAPYVPRWETDRRYTKTPVGRLEIIASGLHPLPLRASQMYLEIWNNDDPYRPRAQRMIIRPSSLGYAYWNRAGARVDRQSGLDVEVIRGLVRSMDNRASEQDLARTVQEIRAVRSVWYANFEVDRSHRIYASLIWWGSCLLWVGYIFARGRHTKSTSSVESAPVSISVG